MALFRPDRSARRVWGRRSRRLRFLAAAVRKAVVATGATGTLDRPSFEAWHLGRPVQACPL